MLWTETRSIIDAGLQQTLCFEDELAARAPVRVVYRSINDQPFLQQFCFAMYYKGFRV